MFLSFSRPSRFELHTGLSHQSLSSREVLEWRRREDLVLSTLEESARQDESSSTSLVSRWTVERDLQLSRSSPWQTWGNQTAIIHDSPMTGQVSLGWLIEKFEKEVKLLADTLKENGHVQQHDVVLIYMLMTPQAIVSERLIILSWEDSVPMD